MLIDNAYFTCIPPEVEEQPLVESEPLHDFIYFLLSNVSRVRMELTVRCLRKLDWSDPVVAEFAIHCLSNPLLPRYSDVPHLASVVAELCSCHEWIG
ncbi:unnamed protein product [Gongylonema pulchrum]|uniref:DUF5071 domain-containing protein n=1 Tax=Gongylonema pulchrum TaxID=637853 RepID=A0A183DHA3_9BILA|nr:unnamed protein product [Gongylonema pulchrum]